MKLKDGLGLLRQYVSEVEPNETFMQQLAEYDLEILSKYWEFNKTYMDWLITITHINKQYIEVN